MISKNQMKLIVSLHQKKFRQLHQMFIVEGEKSIIEFLNSHFKAVHLFVTEPLFETQSIIKPTMISDADLKKISTLATPNNCLAVFQIPNNQSINTTGLLVALDDIRDPGNLGTIIRLCDWFGIETLICSTNTVEVYNPKVVQATMGSLTRVNVQYTDLEAFIQKYKAPVFGTFMEGASIYQMDLPHSGLIIMGNEANGISTSIAKWVTQKMSIPRFGQLQKTESLNVATASAIVLSEFKRKTIH
ncbi:RNA methyltransferase [Flavobacterium branchiophilum]|uniref:Probable tRNA/rRNA methyltransferase n=1 Tax=Flavobacterium branchiophilum (strain FL-15) TaxID=1034807 RepID=G2Z5E9_FLABF|nr:RNA methyltransferase [Flavobacterium branchiophilum]CCB68663.1 Probable tRNA/rRNA methyltransferase [Flavobacterium branchiophilum FL-15]